MQDSVTKVLNGAESGFDVGLLAEGSVTTRRLLVATGLRDVLPDIPGLQERWARDVLHCPYCHIDALLAPRLFRHPETLRQMLTFAPAPAPDVGGQVGYGLGIERRVAPGGIELIGHLGGAGGYYAYTGRMTPQRRRSQPR